VSRYLLACLAAMGPVLVLVSVLAFALTSLAGGDPALEAALQGGGQATPQVVAQLRTSMHLDEPLPVRYVQWLGGVLHGDFGTSFATRLPVGPMLAQVIPATLSLAIAALVMAIVLGLVFGVLGALYHGTLVDRGIRIGIACCLAIPGFWLGFLLIFLFAEVLRWLPAGGFGLDTRLPLPALALGLDAAGAIARLVRSSMLDVLGVDYVRNARSRGLLRASITWRHALPNALIPAVSYAGVQFGHLLGGAVVIESIFAWPGLGRVVLAAVAARDLPVIAGYVLFAGAAFTVVNLMADVIASATDPRLRFA
jgi:peptide/nickel transport system permease protein